MGSHYIIEIKSGILQKCKDWICGTVQVSEHTLSPEEKLILRRKMTSLSENTRDRRILNCVAIIVMLTATILIAVYH
jgi:hypothetical protein